MKKTMKPGHRYFVINIDEPYAKDIFEVLKAGQIAKGEWPEGDIAFEEWVRQTWEEDTQMPHCLSDAVMCAWERGAIRRGNAVEKAMGEE